MSAVRSTNPAPTISKAKAKEAQAIKAFQILKATIIDLANSRDLKNAAEAKAKTLQSQALGAMRAVGSSSLDVVDDANNRTIKATIVTPTSTTLDDASFLEALDAEQREAILTPVIDQAKLQVAINSGLISQDLVAEHTTVEDRASYLKILSRPLQHDEAE
jgi:hypothetical protein